MKKLIFTLFLVVTATGLSVQAHVREGDYLGLPGDNLNLFAVLKLFQESQTLESFERDLNDERTHINNLDLDEDGRIDYIRVVDHVDGDYHTIVMQDALGPHDIQDVAVFTVFRDRHGRVNIQLTGDEALYGRNYIVEPNYSDVSYGETPNPGYSEYSYIDGERIYVTRTTTYEVASWPVIRFIYMPSYSVWVSPWYYSYYPSYWHPWRPYYWHYYYGYHYNWDNYYYSHYRVWHEHHNSYWHDNYYSRRRAYSPVVETRVKTGSYNRTYSRPELRSDGYNRYYKDHPAQQPRRSASTISDPVADRNARTLKNYSGQSDRRTSGNPQTRQGSTNTYNGGTRSTSTGTTGTTGGRRSTETRSTTTKSTNTQPAQSTRETGSGSSRSTTGSGTSTNTQRSSGTSTNTQRSSSGTSTNTERSSSGTSTNTERSSQSSGSNRSATERRTESHPATEQKKASTTTGAEHQGTRR